MKTIIRRIKFRIAKTFFKETYQKMVRENFNKSTGRFVSSVLKNWKAVFLTTVLCLEGIRKYYLYLSWVPVFVLNSDTLQSMTSYVFTISFALFLVFLYSILVKILRFLIVKEWKLVDFLLGVYSFMVAGIIIFLVVGILKKPIWINKGSDLIYINDMYEVSSSSGIVDVYDKRNDRHYECKKYDDYNDSCKVKD